MEKAVIDTSIALKWFVKEKDSPRADLLLARFKEGLICFYAPNIIDIEIANALFYSVSLKGSSLTDSLLAFSQLDMDRIVVDMPLLNRAVFYMQKYTIAIYDCLFIALAEELKVPLITADKKHHKKKFYTKIMYLEDIDLPSWTKSRSTGLQ